MGGIVNEAAENIEFQDQPVADVQSRNISKYWFKEPYYAARWTYFHRPSVWNRMATKGTFDWYGLTGFKTLAAGEKGIGYRGGPRKIGKPSRWILNQGARGLEAVGKGFTKLSTRGYALRAGQYPWMNAPLGPQAGGVLRTIGKGLVSAGGGYRTGGLGGAISGLGWQRGGRFMQELAGGTSLGDFNTNAEKIFRHKVLTPYEQEIMNKLTGSMAGKGIFRATKGAKEAVDLLDPSARAYMGKEGMATATTQLAKGTIFKGAARLMAGVSVGLNIALFGGIMAKLGYAGARRLAESSWDLKMNRSAQMLEFGRGLNIFNTSGASTERSRAIQAIQESHVNARASLGNEAALMSDNY